MNGSRILITGATGMVGSVLVPAAIAAGYEVATTSRRTPSSDLNYNVPWDLSRGAVPTELKRWRPDHIIHLAAWTDVDGCEADPSLAREVNVNGTRQVAALAAQNGARLIFLSTDSVFDGVRGWYTDTDEPNPINVYARTKREGELAALGVSGALILRCNVIGPGKLAWWILGSTTRGCHIPVYSDVLFNPLDVRDLAKAILDLAISDHRGVCHLAGDEVVSKAVLARRLVTAAGLSSGSLLQDSRLADQQRTAKRPLDTSLSMSPRVLDVVPTPRLDSAISRLAREFVETHGTRDPSTKLAASAGGQDS